MACRRFQVNDGYTCIPGKLMHDLLPVIFIPVFELSECPDGDYVTVAANNSGCLTEIFRLITVHNYALFHFKSPAILPRPNIERYHVHAEILSGFLGT